MRSKKDLLKQWKVDLQVVQEEKKMKKKYKNKKYITPSNTARFMNGKILIVKRMGYGSKEINDLRINRFITVIVGAPWSGWLFFSILAKKTLSSRSVKGHSPVSRWEMNWLRTKDGRNPSLLNEVKMGRISRFCFFFICK